MPGIIYGLYEQIINGIITENLNKVDHEGAPTERLLAVDESYSKSKGGFTTYVLPYSLHFPPKYVELGR